MSSVTEAVNSYRCASHHTYGAVRYGRLRHGQQGGDQQYRRTTPKGVCMARDLTQLELLTELEPVAEENVNRHLSMAKEWHPHDYVPWDEGRNFAALGGVDWDPEQS